MDFIAPSKWSCQGDVEVAGSFKLSNGPTGQSEITFDYGIAVGGMPILETTSVTGNCSVEVDVIFSETHAGIKCGTGKPTRCYV